MNWWSVSMGTSGICPWEMVICVHGNWWAVHGNWWAVSMVIGGLCPWELVGCPWEMVICVHGN